MFRILIALSVSLFAWGCGTAQYDIREASERVELACLVARSAADDIPALAPLRDACESGDIDAILAAVDSWMQRAAAR